MTEKPPLKPSPDGGAFVTEKAAKDFERVYERQTGRRWDADHANDNDTNH